MSPLGYVLIRSSYNFGDVISCLRVRMPLIFVEFPSPDGVALLLVGTTVLGSVGFGDFLWYGEGFYVLIWSIVDVMSGSIIAFKSSVTFIVLSSKSFLLDFISWFLVSIAACMMMNCS